MERPDSERSRTGTHQTFRTSAQGTYRNHRCGPQQEGLPAADALCSLSSCLVQQPYRLFAQTKTWLDAQIHCRSQCVDLVTVSDMDQMQTLLDLVEDQHVLTTWVGIHSGAPGWHSTLTNREEERNYWNLTATDEDEDDCVFYSGGKASAGSCSGGKSSVCFDGSKQGRDQYVLVPLLLGWVAAQKHCRTYHTDLLSVRSRAEEETLAAVAAGHEVWLGHFKDRWVWSDGTYSAFRDWSGVRFGLEGAPSCGVMFKDDNGEWARAPCDDVNSFICTCPTEKIIKIKAIPQDSALDLNDPAVLDEILKQISLKQSLVTGDDAVRIRWRKRPDGKVFTKEGNGWQKREENQKSCLSVL
ncbi:lymphocyte antigen 75-like [Brachionichthys hirsutus]|uniref:lymphocyte antigen 75-like n=1 Tax=Brachionichthys hirsutus TaxID=412623 RepID=UPI003604F45C